MVSTCAAHCVAVPQLLQQAVASCQLKGVLCRAQTAQQRWLSSLTSSSSRSSPSGSTQMGRRLAARTLELWRKMMRTVHFTGAGQGKELASPLPLLWFLTTRSRTEAACTLLAAQSMLSVHAEAAGHAGGSSTSRQRRRRCS